jgi:hypothetical protein
MATFAFILVIVVLLPIVGWMAWIAFDNMVGELYDDVCSIRDRIRRRLSHGRRDTA